MKSEDKYYSGRVVSILYEQSPFFILKMKLDGSDNEKVNQSLVSVKGNVLGMSLKKGDWFGFMGVWVKHPEHGDQISIKRAPVFDKGFNADSVVNMLVANGAGRMLCETLKNILKDSFLESLESPELLMNSGILGESSATHLSNLWKEVQKRFTTLSDLSDLKVPPGIVKKVWKILGSEATEKLHSNPWLLCNFEGISFATVDEVARRLEADFSSPERLEGALLLSLKTLRSSTGSTGLSPSGLFAQMKTLAHSSKGNFVKTLSSLRDKKEIKISKVGSKTLVYEPWFFRMEREASHMISHRVTTVEDRRDISEEIKRLMSLTGRQPDTETSLEEAAYLAVQSVALEDNKNLSHTQSVGVANALIHPVSILTGLPGTGKTTSMLVLVRALKALEEPFLLLAPTGIAAKKLSMASQETAYTIHRAFGAKAPDDFSAPSGEGAAYEGLSMGSRATLGDGGKGQEWGYDESSKHPAQVIIIDESSMLDLSLLFRILNSSTDTCRIVFVGDAAQLPSVGAGNVLRDLTDSQSFPTVNLTEIFRQSNTSDIIPAAHSIHAGKVPDQFLGEDFSLLKKRNEEDVLFEIVNLASELKKKGEEFQVISPRHGGMLGVTNLNVELRKFLNPSSSNIKELKLGKSWVLREGDRVMVTRNNYDLGIYNGDVGKIFSINKTRKTVKIKIYDNPPKIIELDYSQVSKLLRLAYACTVHKVQGLEYGTIIMPLTPSFRSQMHRKLLYTAVTRAKKRVVLVGSYISLREAVENDREEFRSTGMVQRVMSERSSALI